MNAIEIYRHPGRFPRVQVIQHAIARAVIALDEIESLALIRAAYASESDAFASVDEARQIYTSIMARAKSHRDATGDGPTTPDHGVDRDFSCPHCGGELVRHDVVPGNVPILALKPDGTLQEIDDTEMFWELQRPEHDPPKIRCSECLSYHMLKDGALVPYEDSAEGFMIVHQDQPPYLSRAGFLLFPDTPQVRALITQWRDENDVRGEMDEAEYLSLERFIEDNHSNLPRFITAWVGDL